MLPYGDDDKNDLLKIAERAVIIFLFIEAVRWFFKAAIRHPAAFIVFTGSGTLAVLSGIYFTSAWEFWPLLVIACMGLGRMMN